MCDDATYSSPCGDRDTPLIMEHRLRARRTDCNRKSLHTPGGSFCDAASIHACTSGEVESCRRSIAMARRSSMRLLASSATIVMIYSRHLMASPGRVEDGDAHSGVDVGAMAAKALSRDRRRADAGVPPRHVPTCLHVIVPVENAWSVRQTTTRAYRFGYLGPSLVIVVPSTQRCPMSCRPEHLCHKLT
jgi:hypothetical protein